LTRVQTGGHMIGMSRDKCGAAAAAGIMRSLAALAPTGVRVVAYLGFVRNSIGSDSYVADEIIRAHSGCRVLVRNTDAEGRMVLSDMLSHARAEIVATPRERRPASTVVHTIATLTGHAVLAHGMGYSIVMDNGPARAAGLSEGLRRVGEAMGDPFEVSHVRREDYDFVAPKTAEYDVIQVNNLPSAATVSGRRVSCAGYGYNMIGGCVRATELGTRTLPVCVFEVAVDLSGTRDNNRMRLMHASPSLLTRPVTRSVSARPCCSLSIRLRSPAATSSQPP
jgi:hypothetical protein